MPSLPPKAAGGMKEKLLSLLSRLEDRRRSSMRPSSSGRLGAWRRSWTSSVPPEAAGGAEVELIALFSLPRRRRVYGYLSRLEVRSLVGFEFPFLLRAVEIAYRDRFVVVIWV
jgi:hypothetical protein